jgi:2-polyprenyl-6-methoxyphenol hydroxylase-like FAD-dependent oxidoreductase
VVCSDGSRVRQRLVKVDGRCLVSRRCVAEAEGRVGSSATCWSGSVVDVTREVVVIGGSLVGLSSALAMSRAGIQITVLERSPRMQSSAGGGLGVDRPLLQRVTGRSDGPPVYRGPDRDTTAWALLRDWLTSACSSEPLVTLRHDVEVTGVAGEAGLAVVTTASAGEWVADVVIGADGVHSTVRRFVDPSRPDARYAGFVLWRVMVGEEDLADRAELPSAHEPSREVYEGGYRLVTYLVPGADGETTRGHRRLNLVWYDPTREQLLRDAGLLEGDVVFGSLRGDVLPEELGSELARIAGQTWPSPWGEALRYGFEERLVFGTPVAEYLPERLTAGPIALAGDAAHAASPMVGGGFREGLYDAAELAHALSSGGEIGASLAAYESERLALVVQHVRRSQQASRSYLAWARPA